MAYPSENRERAEWWLRKIRYSQKFMKPYVDAGIRLRHLYENRANTQREELVDEVALDPGSRAKPSLVFGWIDQSVSNSNAKDPRFRARLRKRGKSQEQDLAQGAESPQDIENDASDYINDFWIETEQRHQDRRVQRDAYFCFGVKKLGVVPDVIDYNGIDRVESEFVEDDADTETLMLSGGQFMQVTENQRHAEHIEKHELALEEDDLDEDAIAALEQNIADHKAYQQGQPIRTDQQYGRAFGVRWPFEDFAMDWMSQDGLRDAGWIAFRVTKPIEDVRNNKQFISAARKAVRPTGRPKDAPAPSVVGGDDDDFGLVTYWEIYARDFAVSKYRRINLMCVVAEQDNGGMVLKHGRQSWERLDGYPCELLTYNQGVARSWFGKPYLLNAGAENTQAIMNEMYDSVLSTIRKHKNLVFFDPDVVDESDALDIVEGPDNIAIPAKGLAQGAAPVVPVDLLPANMDAVNFTSFLTGAFNQAAGTPQPSMSDSETATEAAINERKVTAREDARDEAFEEYQTSCARKLWILQGEFGRDELPDIFRFEIDVAGRAVTTAVERKQWKELLATFAGLVEHSMAMGMPPPNLPAIAEQLLIRGFDIDNPEDLWPAIGLDGVPEQLAGAGMMGQPGAMPGGGNMSPIPTPQGTTTSEVDVIRDAISAR